MSMPSAAFRHTPPQRIGRPDGATAGGEAPWAHLSASDRRFDLRCLQRSLSELVISPPPMENSRRLSAVLIPLYESDGETFVILTRRSAQVRAHPLEVSFPGGAQEACDSSLWQTALREAHEEIRLAPSCPRLLGRMEPRFTVSSNSLFFPYVALLPRRPAGLQADPAEVEKILHVPTAKLLDPAIFREELWPVSDEVVRAGLSSAGELRQITFFELGHDTIWGATAIILRELLQLGVQALREIPACKRPSTQPLLT